MMPVPKGSNTAATMAIVTGSGSQRRDEDASKQVSADDFREG
jgi:hypothetical protein